jgi:hypothetical protein
MMPRALKYETAGIFLNIELVQEPGWSWTGLLEKPAKICFLHRIQGSWANLTCLSKAEILEQP